MKVPSIYILDITRLVSQISKNQPLTGIDRVECAYLKYFLNHSDNKEMIVLGLLRTKLGILVIDSQGLDKIYQWVNGLPLPAKRDFKSWLTRRSKQRLGQIETALRKHTFSQSSVYNSRKAVLSALASFGFASGAFYFNVGHSNLSTILMSSLDKIADLKKIVLLHDVIPLSHPFVTSPKQVKAFSNKVAVCSEYADMIIHPAHATKEVSEAALSSYGRVPRAIVAPLGVIKPQVHPPPPHITDKNYFIVLGTIEPRKNISFLIDIWRELKSEPSFDANLYLVGSLGFQDEDLKGHLSQLPPGVKIMSNVSDSDVAALLINSKALLFPSIAEGFGIPPYEAAALGIPVIASDLKVLQEGLKNYPTYLPINNHMAWKDAILSFYLQSKHSPSTSSTNKIKSLSPPKWSDHFKTVFEQIRL